MNTGTRPLTMVLVVDGLRPDQIHQDITPTISALSSEGRWVEQSFSSIPTVTRVNAASLVTGCYPASHGLFGNYLRTADGRSAVNTLEADFVSAVGLEPEELLRVKSLGHRLAEAGQTLAVVSTISSGGSLVLNPGVGAGHGVTLSLRPGPDGSHAQPAWANDALLEKMGPAPSLRDGASTADLVDYAVDASVSFVLPQVDPDVLVCWFVEPDKSQHRYGVGSPQAKSALTHLDAAISRLVGGAESFAAGRDLTVFVLSDHGFARTIGSIDVAELLRQDGIDLTGVTIVPTGLAMVWCEEISTARCIQEWADQQPWLAGSFLGSRLQEAGDGDHFTVDLLRCQPTDTAPDLVLAPLSAEAPNEFGVPGVHYLLDGSAGKFHSGHGSLSPHELRSTMIVRGPGVHGTGLSTVPAGIVDVIPTVLSLHGVSSQGCDGRVLRELFDASAPEPVVTARTLRSRAHTKHDLEMSILEVDGHDYITAVSII